MSSPEGPDKQDDRTGGEPSTEDEPIEDASEAASSEESVSEPVVETTECPNCGRTFVGDYCPSCGQEADPSVSITEVIGGFFRELVDVENGFWPTFAQLTLRPGKTLQQYLSGVRKGLVSPGRYLVAAVVAVVGVRQISRWIGAKPRQVIDPDMPTADGKTDVFDVSDAYLGSAIEQAPILLLLLVAVPLALSLWTLFSGRFSGGAEALAVGSFLTGHTVFLTKGIDLALGGTGSLLAEPSIKLPLEAVVVFLTAYVGFACWGCFGPGWKPTAKGAFGGAWACGETFGIMGIALTGFAFWIIRADPGAYYFLDPGETQIWRFPIFAGVFSVPLLLHAGTEAYYRLR